MDWQALLVAVLGGGGVTGVAVKIAQLAREQREGKLANEGTAISNWRQIAEYENARADRMADELNFYRRWYPQLWAAYEQHQPPPPKREFPMIPPPPHTGSHPSEERA